MPLTAVRQEFELETRDKYTKVKVEVLLKVDGRELPNGAVLGLALDDAIETIRKSIQESYKVPPRIPTAAQPTPAGAV